MPDDLLAFAHIGDLHITEADAANARDLHAIVNQINAVDGLDFVYLPGDNADNGTPAQYALVRAELDRLRLPVHVIPGDHDMEGGNLGAFYEGLGGPRLPYAVTVSGTRCLFLDMCGPGSGGPDFRLGAEQVAWLGREIDAAEAEGRDGALFMHSYPADLKGEREGECEAVAVAERIHASRIRLVEMGHTHYNELANDGRTIYAAVRSTGQIEEGPVGYTIAAIDRGVVSWRFKELAQGWPFVVITAPADRRLAHAEDHIVTGSTEIRALVLGAGHIAVCEFSIDEGPWRPMRRDDGERRFRATVDWPAGARRLTVRAQDAGGGVGEDRIEPAADTGALVTSKGLGSDADSVGAWADRGLLGTQLGPNRNGRHW